MKCLLTIAIIISFISCGTGETKVVRVPADDPPAQQPRPPRPGGGGGKTSYAEARQLIGKYCESCHANSPWLRDERSLKASGVKGRTQNNSMPPNNGPVKMGNADRQKLINFF